MNKEAFVLAVEDITGQGIPEVTKAVNAMLQVMVHTVASGEPLCITGWGTMEPVIRPSRMARNPATGGTLRTKDRIGVKFSAADRFQELTNGDLPLPATAAELHIKAPRGTATPRAPRTSEQAPL
jgi:DNA-binding protein HU-beta